MTGLEITYLILFLVCIGLSAFFSSSEIAFINLQRLRLKHLQEGTRDWEIAYRKTLDEVRRAKGLT